MTLSLDIPTLDTPRLVLRGPEPRDFDPLAGFLMSPERSWGFGTEPDRSSAWRWFACSIGHWALHGYGYFTIEWKETGQPCGLTGIWNPEGWPEPEIGWVVYEEFEGRGIAFEAASRARQWAYEDLGMGPLTSNIKPGNARSIALAERMGARFERAYDNVHMGEELLYRHPNAADLGLLSGDDHTGTEARA